MLNPGKPESLEILLPTLHGQNARILSYLSHHKTASGEKISKDLGIPRSSVYKCIGDLVRAGLVTRQVSKLRYKSPSERGRISQEVKATDFKIVLENLSIAPRVVITKYSVAAFDLLHKNSGKLFIERNGAEKFASFIELFDAYNRGIIPAFIIAKELGVDRFEVESLISDATADNKT